MSKFTEFCDELEAEIIASYTETISITQAENLAGKFLTAQLETARELQVAELDARMRKSGLKAISAAVYLEVASSGDKKPSDVFINAKVDSDKLVTAEREAYDAAEVHCNALERYYNIFREAHIFYRGQARQSFGG